MLRAGSAPRACGSGAAPERWRCAAPPRARSRAAPAPRSHARRVLAAKSSGDGASSKRKGRGSGSAGGAGRGGRASKAAQAGATWSFDQLMLIWDDAFLHCMRDNTLSAELLRVAEAGSAALGRGAVLCCVRVETAPPPGSARKGFGAAAPARARPADFKRSDVSPPSRVAASDVRFVPRAALLALRAAPGATADDEATAATAGGVPVVPPALLRTLLGAQDLTQLLTLTAPPGDDDPLAADVLPYDAAAGELVVLLAATVDGQPAVLGADVVERAPSGGLRTKGLEDDVASS